jgi:hypothetical protein
MKDLLTGATRIAKRSAPAAAVAAAVALSMSADSGLAARARSGSERPNFTFAVSRRVVTLTPGSSARLTIVIRRRQEWQSVLVGVASKLPRGISASFAPSQTSGWRAFLTLRASVGAGAGRYRLRVRAIGGYARRTIVITLKVIKPTGRRSHAGQPPPFTITGHAANPLQPGVPQPLDLVMTNPNSAPLILANLTVTIEKIVASRATAVLPCPQSDFAVEQYSGGLPLSVPGSSTRSLSELGITPLQWPGISLVDRATNQDGCQGASLTLGYNATARLG